MSSEYIKSPLNFRHTVDHIEVPSSPLYINDLHKAVKKLTKGMRCYSYAPSYNKTDVMVDKCVTGTVTDNLIETIDRSGLSTWVSHTQFYCMNRHMMDQLMGRE